MFSPKSWFRPRWPKPGQHSAKGNSRHRGAALAHEDISLFARYTGISKGSKQSRYQSGNKALWARFCGRALAGRRLTLTSDRPKGVAGYPGRTGTRSRRWSRNSCPWRIRKSSQKRERSCEMSTSCYRHEPELFWALRGGVVFRLACARSKQLRPRSFCPPVCIRSCGVRRAIRGHGCLSPKYGRRSKHATQSTRLPAYPYKERYCAATRANIRPSPPNSRPAGVYLRLARRNPAIAAGSDRRGRRRNR